ncbi:molecular chaperone TorD family protein [Adlercreutzia sp. R25]|uniref:TorD/DmsD family molecular chaperone n=1 Tax=Adlercreutzia shanghongiae TaxID=3111773 RepID=UPI002DB55A28|nr:molecular chaperone TorD family protein [Adlercreutzia sp. R25]MEC4273252.1 molecular chaperone TorD family protein [Adlercreutzia sp. R25]
MTAINSREDLSVYLAARSYLYRFFQSLFGAEPTPEALGAYNAELTDACLEALSVDENVRGPFRRRLQTVARDAQNVAADLRSAYTVLFVGPGEPAGSPWESLHRGVERRLFTDVTLAVRRAFKAQGLTPQLGPGVADDALALELDFLAALALRAQSALSGGEGGGGLVPEDARAPLAASRQFLADHLNQWVDALRQCVVDADSTGFYADATGLLVDFCALDEQALARLTDEAA